MSLTDDARTEAKRRWPAQDHMFDLSAAMGFVQGVEWAESRPMTDGERQRMRTALERSFWPFLAHDPHKPELFWGQAVNAAWESSRGGVR